MTQKATNNQLPVLTRKELLPNQSDLNRRQLFDELADFKSEAHLLKNKLNSIGLLAFAAARLTGSVSSIGQAFIGKNEMPQKKSSLISKILNALQTGALIWDAMRSHPKKSQN